MKKLKLTFDEADLGFLTTALEARIHEYHMGRTACSKDIADIVVDALQSLLDRINLEREKLVDYED